MKISLPTWGALLWLFFVPGIVNGEYAPGCPNINIIAPAPPPIFLTGVTASVAVTLEETPGNCNGMEIYPYKRWYWEVVGNATPTSGQGQTAIFTNWGKGKGTVNFELICRSKACPDCNAEYRSPVPFCVEDGPYYSPWSCIQGATMNLEAISLSSAVVCLGDTISASATLSKTAGQKTQMISYDCSPSVEVTNSESVSVNKGYSITGPCATNGTGLSCTFTPTNPGVGIITMWAEQAVPNAVCAIDPYYVHQTTTYTVLKTDIIGHQPGEQSILGSEIPEEHEDDAKSLRISVNDDNDDEIDGRHQDNEDTSIDSKDNDIVAITLKPIEPSMRRGTMTLAVYPAASVQVFKPDGAALLEDFSVDLASPQGDLSALVSTPVIIYIEGMKPGEDVALSLTYTDGSVSCSDEVHLQVMQVDLDIDSENDSAFSPTGWTDTEDQEEDDTTLPGKYIGVNDGDVDADGIPNYADGYDLWDAGASAGGNFTPMALELKEPIDLATAKVKFTYSCSDPKEVTKTPAPTPADSDRYTAAPGHLRIWKADGSADRKRAEVGDGGDFIKSGVQYSAQDLGFGEDRTVILYVEGIHPSDEIGDQRILVEVVPNPERPLACSDAIRCTLLQAAIVPDWDHNRRIEDSDRGHATAINPFRFWINDDDDFGDISEGDSDVPGQGGLLDKANCDDNNVNGRSDLLDFFPIWLDVSQPIKLLDRRENWVFVLRQADEALNFLHSGLSRTNAGSYLIEESKCYGWSLSALAHELPTIPVLASGVDMEIYAILATEIQRDPEKGVLILEGKDATCSPLVLEIHKGNPEGALLYETQLPLSLSGVEGMCRWINLRHLTGGAETKHTDTNPPTNFPDAFSNGKQVVFSAGFNNTENDHRASSAEVFKRLYWAGSRAMFTGVSWEGNEDPWSRLLPVEVNYHLDVENAFAVASNFAQSVTSLPGQKYVIAHSLGNMVVSSAIRDHKLSISNYFMVDAAVAIEAYNASQLAVDNMRPINWIPYSGRTWAANWHKLWNFDPNDARNNLTWLNRFGEIPNAVNYYSSGEDILQNSPLNPSTFLSGAPPWAYQELIKGRWQSKVIVRETDHGGWGFNSQWIVSWEDAPRSNVVNNLTDSALRSAPVYKPFYSTNIYGASGSQFVSDPDVRAKLLGEAIPALSFAAGANSVPLYFNDNRDMNVEFKTPGAAWPRSSGSWEHGDYRGVAYLFNYGLYNDMVSQGVFQ